MTLEQTAEVRDELERIVASQQFRASRRCKRLLRHITEHALVGDVGVLKERSLGIDVSGRTPDYDTSEDPIVRATAAETRKKLAQYYQDNSHAHELRIKLLAGSYVAEFHSAQDPPPARAEPVRWLRRSAIIAALVGLGILGRGWLTGAPSALDRFWAPTLATSGAVLTSLGQPVAYNLLSPQAQDRIQATAVDSDSHAAAPRTGTIPINQLIILRDRCVAIGDAVCLARMAALLENTANRIHLAVKDRPLLPICARTPPFW